MLGFYILIGVNVEYVIQLDFSQHNAFCCYYAASRSFIDGNGYSEGERSCSCYPSGTKCGEKMIANTD